MPGFFFLCLNMFRVKPAVTAEPNAVAEITGNRPPSRMSAHYAHSITGSVGGVPSHLRTQRGRQAKSSAPPSAYLDPNFIPGAPRRPRPSDGGSTKAPSISSVMSEHRADTVRRVKERYHHNPTEHMRLTHAMEEWKEAEDKLNRLSYPNHRRGKSGGLSKSGSGSTSDDGGNRRRVRVAEPERTPVSQYTPSSIHHIESELRTCGCKCTRKVLLAAQHL